ncbi:hypothetical protein ACN4EG_06610 [Alkalinema pantanalense CENA528]|uniref:hypothetical protein n=1 Tax=Alkalinema pantanalense TaxID=1620705 RepID=UPI003D6DEF0A
MRRVFASVAILGADHDGLHADSQIVLPHASYPMRPGLCVLAPSRLGGTLP